MLVIEKGIAREMLDEKDKQMKSIHQELAAIASLIFPVG